MYGSFFDSKSRLATSPAREIQVFPKHIKSTFCDNSVATSRYNIISFIPRSLLEQFRRVANLYFLFISVLMLIGTYTTWYDSPLSPWSTLIVLIFVLMVSMGKEAAEDIKRHAADREVNQRITKSLNHFAFKSHHQFDDIEWKNVRVGDVLQIFNNSEIPADMILLTTSELLGCAYIETSNIDGETNLKVKCSAPTGKDGLPAWNQPASLIG